MKLVDKLLCLFGLLLLFSFRALAHDPSMAHHEWFNKQEMTPERGRTRLYAWHSIPKPRVLRLLYQMKNPATGRGWRSMVFLPAPPRVSSKRCGCTRVVKRRCRSRHGGSIAVSTTGI